ncbi:MAG: hypothetical protein CUN55_09360 [Phototrophicales bacterium]|nr:MAG: hypothetical protein CUN55_09360 [Phototrophicales bacterium]
MNINELIRMVSTLSPAQKAQLVEFIRQQTTSDLNEALEEIMELLREMGVLIEHNGNVADARQRIEAMRQLARLL